MLRTVKNTIITALMASYTSETGEYPYLSVVVASRNDNHGGDILKRMRLFVGGLLEQTRRYRFPIELVFVEWNPPENTPRMHEVLPRPGVNDYLSLRYITVPGSIHQRYRHAREIPLFQMIAKNVGIRRARGAFILCANVDLLFSDSLFRILAEKSYREDTFYRANRCDVPDCIDLTSSLPEQLAWCERNIIRRLGRDLRYQNISLELVGLQNKSRVKKWIFDKTALGMRLFWPPEKRMFYQLDLFACGDFTLMSRGVWEAIQGYLELDSYSLHIDSLALIAAAALGFRQCIFPPEACTYHISHPDGWETLSPLAKIKFLSDRPALDYALVVEAGLDLLKQSKPFDLNPPNWGLTDKQLDELEFTPPQAVARPMAVFGG